MFLWPASCKPQPWSDATVLPDGWQLWCGSIVRWKRMSFSFHHHVNDCCSNHHDDRNTHDHDDHSAAVHRHVPVG